MYFVVQSANLLDDVTGNIITMYDAYLYMKQHLVFSYHLLNYI